MSEADSAVGGGWRRTSALGFAVRGVVGLRNALLPIAAILFGSGGYGDIAPVALIAIPAVVAINLLFSWIAWRHFRYRLGAEDISVESGLLNRATRSVPYERIQDVSLEQALLPRVFGMVEVKFETGAGGKDELKIAYVSETEGEALRETVRARKDGVGESSSPEAERAPEETKPLFAMGVPRLLTFGLFEFSLVVFAVLGGLAQQIDFLLPFDFWDRETWSDLLNGSGDWLFHLGLIGQLIGAALAATALALFGLLTGIARTVLRDWGFRLDNTPKGLRRRRGLLTRTDVVMPLHRVQALKITTGAIRRLFGWHGLQVVSLAQDAKSESHTVVPFATMEEIAPVVGVTDFALPGETVEWHRPSPRYRLDHALMEAGPLVLVALTLAVLGLFLPAAIVGGIASLAALRQHFLWRYDRHATDGRQLYVRKGWLAPHLDIASRIKLQSIEIRQGPISRRRGYADLHFGLAGGTLVMHGIPKAQAHAIRASVLASISKVDFSELPG